MHKGFTKDSFLSKKKRDFFQVQARKINKEEKIPKEPSQKSYICLIHDAVSISMNIAKNKKKI